MANREETSSPEFHCVYIETSLNTRFALLVHKYEIISDFRDKLRKEHIKVFPEIGEINVSALKVKRRKQFYHLSDSMNVCKAFDGISGNWFIYVDAVRVDKVEEEQADQNGSKLELVEKTKEKKTKKRKNISSDVKKSQKKLIVNGEMEKDIGSGENKDITMGLEEKILTVNSELVDNASKDVPGSETPNGALEKLDDLTGATGHELADGQITSSSVDNLQTAELVTQTEKQLESSSALTTGTATAKKRKRTKSSKDHINQSKVPDLGKGEKTAELVKIDPEKDLQPASELADGRITSRGEGSRLAPSSVDNLQTDELVTQTEKRLKSSSRLTTGTATEKKRKRTKSSKDHINQSNVAATTTSLEIVNEIPGNVDCVDATSKSCPVSERETSLVEAIQKETDKGEKSVQDVGRDNIVTENLASHPANPLEANSVLTTSPVTPVTEKKKKRKKSSKNHINQSAAVATTTSREIANEMNKVPENVDRVNGTSESCPISRRENLGKENEKGEKINEDVGSGKPIPSSVDNIQTDNLVSYPKHQLEASCGLTTGPATEKKKRNKSSKDHINQSAASKEIVNEGEKVSGSIDQKLAATLADAIQNDKLQAENNLQATDLVSTPHTLVQESREHEVSKEKVEIDADQAKSVKSTSTKKKSSRKSKTPAKENTLVDSGVQNVEPIKVVDGEGPDNVIRNVLDSLQQRDDAEENLDERGKKSTKRSKKKQSSKPQVLSVEVNNAAQKEATPTNNPEDTDALFTPANKDTERDASHLKKSIQVADNTEDNNNPSKQIPKDNDDMAEKDDIVGDGNKQDQVTCGAKSIIVKPKERRSRVQPPRSGTSLLQSGVKNNRNKSKVDHSNASVKGAVNNKKEAVKKRSDSVTVNKTKMNINKKKEAVKKSSNSVTVNKSKMNFFKDADKSNSTDDESNKTTSNVSTKSPSDSSADDDSDVSSMSRKQGNNISGGTNRFSGSLQDILRSSKSYKKAKLTASQSQPDDFDIEGQAN